MPAGYKHNLASEGPAMDAKVLCLGALHLGDASGYEIKKLFEEGDFSHFYESSFGSIYPALNKLVEDGLAVFTEQPQDKRPDKKVYSITDKGRDAFAKALQAPAAPDRYRSDFCFIMVFGHLVSPDRLAKLIDAQTRFYEANITRMESHEIKDAPASVRFIHNLGLAVYRTAAAYLDRNKGALLDAVRDEQGAARAAE
jgi:PadR family transcriptional regulator AphA